MQVMDNFRAAIKSKYTKDDYERKLKYVLSSLDMSSKELIALGLKDPRGLEDKITDLIMRERERIDAKEVQANHLYNILKPIKLICTMNDVVLNWDKLRRLVPSSRRFSRDRLPSIQELRRLTEDSDQRIRVAVLLMCSGGLRVGALSSLRFRDIESIIRNDKLVCAKIVVYSNEPEEYCSYVTPEAYKALESYKSFRERFGEIVNKDSAIFRNNFDNTEKNTSTAQKNIRPLTVGAIEKQIELALWRTGIRTSKAKRHEFSIHSFRRYFKTKCELVMRPTHVEMLMGHSTGISGHYYRPQEKDLLEDYLKAAPDLIISEKEELRHENTEIQTRFESVIKSLEERLNRIELERLKEKVEAKTS